MRACMHCGLSIGELATFCPVCGAVVDGPAAEDDEAAGNFDDDDGPLARDETPEGDSAAHVPGDQPAGIDDEAGSVDAMPPSEDPPANDIAARLESPGRRATDVAALLQDALAAEADDAPRAAVVYREAIVAGLEATEDLLVQTGGRRELLEGFDRLSLLLERQGLPEEALEVVEDAASLGLLDDDGSPAHHRDGLRRRREDLRYTLFVDSAQL